MKSIILNLVNNPVLDLYNLTSFITHHCDWTNNYDSVDVLTQVWVMVGVSSLFNLQQLSSSSPFKLLELQMCQQPMQFTVRLFSLITLVQEEVPTRIIFLATLLCNIGVYFNSTSSIKQKSQLGPERLLYTGDDKRNSWCTMCAFITFWLKLDKAENCNPVREYMMFNTVHVQCSIQSMADSALKRNSEC